MTRRFVLLTVCAVSLMLVSCVKDPDNKINGEVGPDVNQNTVTFVIGGGAVTTKSLSKPVGEPIDLSEESGIDGLQIIEDVTSMDPCYEGTKGTPIFTENFATYSSLAATAYSGANEFLATVPFANTEGSYEWSHTYESGTWWPEDGNGLDFYFQAPENPTGCSNIKFDNTEKTISFDYTSPAIATNQTDVLFSMKHLDEATKDTDNKVLLYHALSAVKFKLGQLQESERSTKLQITAITKIEFLNVNSKGSCVIKPSTTPWSQTSNPGDASTADSEKSSEVTTWTNVSTPANFSQEFTSSEQNANVLPAFGNPSNMLAGETTHTEHNINSETASKTFFFIPQKISENVKIKLTYTYTDGTATYANNVTTIDFGAKMLAKDSNYEWKEGEIRTYTLSLGDDVKVAITDTANETQHKKSDLVITNTGTATSYMRVAVVGNWYYDKQATDAADVPVAITPCQLESYKSYIRTSDWIEGADGYYYYKHPVLAGHTILPANTLFGDVTFTEQSPYKNCHLEVKLAVQAVRAGQVGDAWGGIKVADSSDNVVDKLDQTTKD